MRHLLAVLLLVAAPVMAGAQTYTDMMWKLLAIDGTLIEARTTLRIDKDNVLAGAAPCNRWQAMNKVDLPALQLGGIRSTRMVCDRMADEQAFFDALTLMTKVDLLGERNLVLTGPDGKTMEFVPDVADGAADGAADDAADGAADAGAACKTCPPTE